MLCFEDNSGTYLDAPTRREELTTGSAGQTVFNLAGDNILEDTVSLVTQGDFDQNFTLNGNVL